MLETLIEAGLRWGELIAPTPRHFDFLRRSLAVEERIVEVSKTHSPTDLRYLPSSPRRSPTRNTFRTRIWLPVVKARGVDFPVLVHDLRYAHAALLAAAAGPTTSP